jgi:hypothetical protein
VPDDRIYDAINLFKYSQTGLGARAMPGPSAHQERYRMLARQANAELWSRWAQDDIAFAEMEEYGLSGRYPDLADIRVDNTFEPVRDRYDTPIVQARLAATSLILSHEAVHLVNGWGYLVQEILCRSLQSLYFQDVQSPREYRSRVTGQMQTAQLLPLDQDLESLIADHTERLAKLRLQQVVDLALANPTYRAQLTAGFVRDSLWWWGGPENRWPSTRSMYLRVLAASFSGSGLSPAQMTDTMVATTCLLEAFENPTQWQAGRWALGDVEALRRVYDTRDTRIAPDVIQAQQHRVRTMQSRLGEVVLRP